MLFWILIMLSSHALVRMMEDWYFSTKLSIHWDLRHLFQMVSQISHTPDWKRQFLGKAVPYLLVFTVLTNSLTFSNVYDFHVSFSISRSPILPVAQPVHFASLLWEMSLWRARCSSAAFMAAFFLCTKGIARKKFNKMHIYYYFLRLSKIQSVQYGRSHSVFWSMIQNTRSWILRYRIWCVVNLFSLLYG